MHAHTYKFLCRWKRSNTARELHMCHGSWRCWRYTLFCIAVFEMPFLLLCPFSFKSLFVPRLSCHRVPSLNCPCIFFLYLLRTYFFFFGVLFTCLSSVYISSDLALLWFHSVIKTPSPKGREEWCWSSHSSCHLCSMTSHTDSHANRSKRKGRKGVNACLNSPRSKSNQNSSKCNILLAVFCFFGLPAPLRLSMLFFLSFW